MPNEMLELSGGLPPHGGMYPGLQHVRPKTIRSLSGAVIILPASERRVNIDGVYFSLQPETLRK